jgi:hypothetical protein
MNLFYIVLSASLSLFVFVGIGLIIQEIKGLSKAIKERK